MSQKKGDIIFRNYMNFQKVSRNYIESVFDGTSLYEVKIRIHVNETYNQYSVLVRLINSQPIRENILLKVKPKSHFLKYLSQICIRNEMNDQSFLNIYKTRKIIQEASNEFEECVELLIIKAQGSKLEKNHIQNSDVLQDHQVEDSVSLDLKYFQETRQSSANNLSQSDISHQDSRETKESESKSIFYLKLKYFGDFMKKQFTLSRVMQELEPHIIFLSPPCQIKVFREFRLMFLAMKEQINFHRSAFSFQLLLYKF